MDSFALGRLAKLLVGGLALMQFAVGANEVRAQDPNHEASLHRDADAAWNQRAATIKSLILIAEIDQFEKGQGNRPFETEGPFAEQKQIKDYSFKASLDYAFKQGKVAYFRTSPIGDATNLEAIPKQTIRATFDGQQNSPLFVEDNVTRGYINKNGTPDGIVGQNADLLAVNLWLHPQAVLRRMGWSTGRVSVEENAVESDGIQCRRVRIPRDNPAWTSAIDFDAERGWVPIRYQAWHGGKLTTSVAIKYEEQEKLGPVVKEWVYSHYNHDGELEQSRTATVKQCQVNCDIDDSRFTIKFPIGTQVSEKVGDKNHNLIQGADGLQLLKEGGSESESANDPFGSLQIRPTRIAARFVAFSESAKQPGVMSSEQLRADGFTQLSTDNSLADWDMKPWHEKHWTIEEGVINYDGRGENKDFQKNSLWTKKDYGDLQMYAEWRLPAKPKMKPHPIVLYNGDFLLDENKKRITRPQLDAGDSGIMFRGIPKCQANIWSQELGSGEINGYRTDRKMPQSVRRACIPIKNADHPLGQWNVFLITLKGDRLTVDTNGERVIDAAELPNLPKAGPIGLQHHGDPVQFRQLWVKAL